MKKIILSHIDTGDYEIALVTIFNNQNEFEQLKKDCKKLFQLIHKNEGNDFFRVYFDREVFFDMDMIDSFLDDAQVISDEELFVFEKYNINNVGGTCLKVLIENQLDMFEVV